MARGKNTLRGGRLGNVTKARPKAKPRATRPNAPKRGQSRIARGGRGRTFSRRSGRNKTSAKSNANPMNAMGSALDAMGSVVGGLPNVLKTPTQMTQPKPQKKRTIMDLDPAYRPAGNLGSLLGNQTPMDGLLPESFFDPKEAVMYKDPYAHGAVTEDMGAPVYFNTTDGKPPRLLPEGGFANYVPIPIPRPKKPKRPITQDIIEVSYAPDYYDNIPVPTEPIAPNAGFPTPASTPSNKPPRRVTLLPPASYLNRPRPDPIPDPVPEPTPLPTINPYMERLRELYGDDYTPPPRTGLRTADFRDVDNNGIDDRDQPYIGPRPSNLGPIYRETPVPPPVVEPLPRVVNDMPRIPPSRGGMNRRRNRGQDRRMRRRMNRRMRRQENRRRQANLMQEIARLNQALASIPSFNSSLRPIQNPETIFQLPDIDVSERSGIGRNIGGLLDIEYM